MKSVFAFNLKDGLIRIAVGLRSVQLRPKLNSQDHNIGHAPSMRVYNLHNVSDNACVYQAGILMGKYIN